MLKEIEQVTYHINGINCSGMPDGYNSSDWLEFAKKYSGNEHHIMSLKFSSEEDIKSFLKKICYEYGEIVSSKSDEFAWMHNRETHKLLVEDITKVSNRFLKPDEVLTGIYGWSGDNKIEFEDNKIVLSLGTSVRAKYKVEKDDVIETNYFYNLNGHKVNRRIIEEYTTDWLPAAGAELTISWTKNISKVYSFHNI